METITDATGEFLDAFRGRPHGWLSDSAARCLKAGGAGGAICKAVLAFEDGAAFQPLIARDAARAQSRPCWSELVRDIWRPESSRRGQSLVCILTTDTKKRLWPRARVGPLGENTPVLLYDAKLCLASVAVIHWPGLLSALDLIEEVYAAGFSKRAIRESLYGEWETCRKAGVAQSREWESRLATRRATREFDMALLIAQKPQSEETEDTK